MIKNTKLYAILACCILVALFSCNDDILNTGRSMQHLAFSTDTLTFDTIFSSIGSTTKSFKIYNKGSETLQIDKIYLANNSKFRLNIDGERGSSLKNVSIYPNDSLFVFVEITVDPSSLDAPVLISDSVVFKTSQQTKNLQLEAWGQDMHFYENQYIETETWTADKPRLIYGYLIVKEGHTLTIEEGVQVHFHGQKKYMLDDENYKLMGSLIVEGSLVVNGTMENPVVFQGDRLEEMYDDVTSQWGVIALTSKSEGNVMNYAQIKNAVVGLQVGDVYTLNKQPNLLLSNSIIANNSAYGISAVGAQIQCFNTLVYNSGIHALSVINGGEYEFNHCTFTSSIPRISNDFNPLLYLSNYSDQQVEDAETGEIYTYRFTNDLKNITFNNSIIYGEFANEMAIDTTAEKTLNYHFQNSMVNLNKFKFDLVNNDHFTNCIFNQDPKFKNPKENNFELDTLSLAKNAGDLRIVKQHPEFLSTDLKGVSRLTGGIPDLGAFESSP